MPKTSKKTALDPLERFLRKVEQYPFPGRETQDGGKLTISQGLVGYPEDCADANQMNRLIKMADKAMYVSKSKGRNCITVCGDRLN